MGGSLNQKYLDGSCGTNKTVVGIFGCWGRGTICEVVVVGRGGLGAIHGCHVHMVPDGDSSIGFYISPHVSLSEDENLHYSVGFHVYIIFTN